MFKVNMRRSFIEVTVEERQRLNTRIQEIFVREGKELEFMKDDEDVRDMGFPRDMAYMSHNPLTGRIKLCVGDFWFEEDNLCPVIAMAHELGHYVDLRDNFNFNYNAYHGTQGTLELEVKAWEHGLKFIKELGMSEEYNDAIYKYVEHCLRSYYSEWRFPADQKFNFKGEPPTFNDAKARVREAMGYNPVEEEEDQFMIYRELGRRIGLSC